MPIKLYKDAALTRDLPDHGLKRGDLVKIVDRHEAPSGERGYSIEVFTAVGETLAVAVVPEDAVEPLHADEVLHVRRLAS